MSRLLQVGMSTAGELHHAFGHIACTLGGVNYESRGGKGCLRGSAARGATHQLFRHAFHLVLSDAAAAEAKKYADACVGQRYVLGGVPSKNKGGDCSGFVSGIICAARGKPIKRLFSTATWLSRFDDSDIGFRKGLGGGVAVAPISAIGRPDRPFPGRELIKDESRRSDNVRWVQARLNCAVRNKHPELGGRRLGEDGLFGNDTLKAVKGFQRRHSLDDDGRVGRLTWRKLLAVH